MSESWNAARSIALTSSRSCHVSSNFGMSTRLLSNVNASVTSRDSISPSPPKREFSAIHFNPDDFLWKINVFDDNLPRNSVTGMRNNGIDNFFHRKRLRENFMKCCGVLLSIRGDNHRMKACIRRQRLFLEELNQKRSLQQQREQMLPKTNTVASFLHQRPQMSTKTILIAFGAVGAGAWIYRRLF